MKQRIKINGSVFYVTTTKEGNGWIAQIKDVFGVAFQGKGNSLKAALKDLRHNASEAFK